MDRGLDANAGLLAKQTNPKGRDKVNVKNMDQVINKWTRLHKANSIT